MSFLLSFAMSANATIRVSKLALIVMIIKNAYPDLLRLKVASMQMTLEYF